MVTSSLPQRFAKFRSGWRHVDWSLLLLSIALVAWGGLAIRSTEIADRSDFALQHWILGGLCLPLVLLVARCRYEVLIRWHWLTYGLVNALLVAVMVAGVSAKGAQRWIPIGGFNIQPSEFAKLGAIVTLAALLHAKPASTLPALFRTLLVVAVPWGLVFLQPDLGTSLVFGAIALGMLYWGNAKLGWLVLMVSPLVAAILFNLYLPGWFAWTALMTLTAWLTLPLRWMSALGALVVNALSGGLGILLWRVLKDYQKDRLILFLEPERDPLGGGYHLIQSRIAIGAGQLWGRGLNEGTQTQLNFIPEQHTDFIFSAIGEELGFIGSIGLLVIFWLICTRLVFIALNAKENFGSLLAVGVLSMLVFQVFVNIGMTVGLAPITGIPLPWVSYGRSAMVTNFLAIALVESVANHSQIRSFFQSGD
ncbi:rod shape-determining protein RodA [Rubidibacter lacunae KORDI 51-2]|uniref:Peptidoglycan glycosyltransferase RodA n=1 Tax=Rubidibacter lacunae KORDI 51-2 TaxID=582515 RepID=U5DJU2_9CHRO|nr:rod shape-determining protein RodA [Rubidibacter lacunae]ERN39955.1 rod shape-determining protein RodA [Rubidibacter lacunae KORDI 51-2]